MKNILYVLLGAALMFVVIMYIGKMKEKTKTPSQSSDDFKRLLNTSEAQELLRSNEFANVLLTKEFRILMKGMSDIYLKNLTKTLIG